MTKPQLHLFSSLTDMRAVLEADRKRLGVAKQSPEHAFLCTLISVFGQDAVEQWACARDMERLQQEKATLTAQLKAGDRVLLATATQLRLVAALRAIERQRRVHHLRRLAATAALGLHEQAGRAILRTLNRALAVDARAYPQLPST